MISYDFDYNEDDEPIEEHPFVEEDEEDAKPKEEVEATEEDAEAEPAGVLDLPEDKYVAPEPVQSYYIDNQEFMKAVSAHNKVVAKARRKKQEPPAASDYIGSCLLKIARGLARRPNFNGYVYKEDMIAEGVEKMLRYIENFDPAKGTNAFAYFSQICWFTFCSVIMAEKKQLYTRYKMTEKMVIDRSLVTDPSANVHTTSSFLDYDNLHEFVRNYEKRLTKSKNPPEPGSHRVKTRRPSKRRGRT